MEKSSPKEKAIVVAAINGARPYKTDNCSFVSSTYYFVAYGGHLHQIYLKELDRAWKMMDSFDGGDYFLASLPFEF